MSATCDRLVVSSTNKTDRHIITEILLKVALNTIIKKTHLQETSIQNNNYDKDMEDKYYIYHGSYELTYLNQRIRRMSWFK